MIVSRKALTAHLSRIHCGGEIGEVVLSENFKCNAISRPSQQLGVHTGGLEGVESLADPVGVLNLGLLVKSLKTFGEDDNDNIGVTFDGFKIEIAEEGRGSIHLVTGEPKTIPTNVTAKAMEKLLGDVDFKTGRPLPQSFVSAIMKAQSLLKADTVTITVSDEISFKVGSQNSDYADVALPNPAKKKKGKKAAAADSYDLIVDARMLVNILSQLDDFTASQIQFTGADSILAVWDEQTTYILSPLEEEPS